MKVTSASSYFLLLIFALSGCDAGNENEMSTDPQANGNEDGLQAISVALTVPDAGWEVKIERIAVVEDELWVLSRLERSPDLAAQVISTAEDSVTLRAPDLPIQHFILGKTWTWENEEPYTFLDDISGIEEELRDARILYSADG